MRRMLITLCILGMSTPLLAAGHTIPEQWKTRAELSDFKATSSIKETVAFLKMIEAETESVHLSSFGATESGRSMPLIVVAQDIAPTPEASHKAGRPIIFMICGIHPGEIDGKDAIMMLLRDHALGSREALGKETTLLIVPVYNVDGHERVSPFHRPTQNGPVDGMGFRTTNRGLDLNRDFMKLDSLEAQALIALFNEWRPHLVVDNHVTNGSDHEWVLTYAYSEAPELPAPLDLWFQDHMPRVVQNTKAKGHPCGPYVSLIDGLDPSKGFNSTVSDPRFSSGYFPLRNRPTILVEMHAHKPFKQRVLANRDFLRALIREVEREPQALIDAVKAAEIQTVNLGRRDAETSSITLRWKADSEADTVTFPAKTWTIKDSLVTGGQMLVFDPDELQPIEVPWIHKRVPDLTAVRPRGYLVLPGWPQIEARIAGHGLEFTRLTHDIELEVETLRLDDPKFATSSYQGLVRVKPKVMTGIEKRNIPKGTLWIKADQPDFELAVQLFEPEAPDSLVQWGLLNSAFERKVWIGREDLEAFAVEQLKNDAVRAEWNTQLEDEAFKADPAQRYLWWYRRTPEWDETVGLLPIMRLHTLPENWSTQ